MPRKKKANTMGSYMATPDEMEAMRWCINNHIKISPVAIPNKSEWAIDVQIGHNKANRSPKTFGPGEIWEVIYSYYNHYYAKKKNS